MSFVENMRLALRAIRGNMLRTSLTFLIIAFGIMALVGILTAVASLKSSIYSNFTSLGSNTFTIVQSGSNIRRHGGGFQEKEGPVITYEQARLFKERYHFPSQISLGIFANENATVTNGSKKTNPNIGVWGIDENYLQVSGYDLAEGRYFTNSEVQNGANTILLGTDVVSKLFGDDAEPIGQYVFIGNSRYEVIGVLKSKGNSLVRSADNQVFIPILNAIRSYTGYNHSVSLGVMVPRVEQLDVASDEATGVFRNIRGLKLNQKDDFEIDRADALANSVIDNMSTITAAAIIIGIITLFGAGIGLMNIMLVSVTERTREIGVTKALGATKSVIRTQFLIEAIVICQIGGALGIVLGILAGNCVSLLIGGTFIIPWGPILLGISFCFIVGLAAGIYPAIRASRLDPIEALRYE
jgi:putative ABC transport system permease protein